MSWFRDFEAVVQRQVPLAPLTTYRVGGPAEFFAQPRNDVELGALLRRAAAAGVRTHFLGHGTNLLVADSGVSGLVIKLPKAGFGHISRSRNRVTIGAGHSLPGLVKWSVAESLSGLECLQGVPGTVGAALRMNAGGKYGEIGASVRRVRGFEADGTPFDFAPGQCGFVYRNSGLSGKLVTACELELQPGDPARSAQLLKQILAEKIASQPVSARSAGCAFKNPKRPGIAPAGKLIDELGMKGLRIGGAEVSMLHANFLVCNGPAAAADIAALIRAIRERVWVERGVALELEVEVWGLDAEQLQPPAFPRAA